MNDTSPTSALDIQVNALMQRVTHEREQRCSALRAAARSQGDAIVTAAYREARSMVHQAVIQERARIEQGLKQAEARAQLEARQRDERHSLARLQQMWANVGPVLERRWCSPQQRRSWIEAALSSAGVLIAGRAWRIEHGGGWREEEQAELEALAIHEGAATVKWRLDTTIAAGLRICAPGVCVDATVAGLVAQRDAVESMFLAEYHAPGSATAVTKP